MNRRKHPLANNFCSNDDLEVAFWMLDRGYGDLDCRPTKYGAQKLKFRRKIVDKKLEEGVLPLASASPDYIQSRESNPIPR